MKQLSKLQLALCTAALALTTSAWAKPPEWAGNGKHQHEQHERNRGNDKHERHNANAAVTPVAAPIQGQYFTVTQRDYARDYYRQHYGKHDRKGRKHCPPGLAKKNNGCMPPGQAKKWQMGQPLPANIVLYPVPQPVLVQLPPAPQGYRYARVANDIVLMAVGSRMVVDAITDLLAM